MQFCSCSWQPGINGSAPVSCSALRTSSTYAGRDKGSAKRILGPLSSRNLGFWLSLGRPKLVNGPAGVEICIFRPLCSISVHGLPYSLLWSRIHLHALSTLSTNPQLASAVPTRRRGATSPVLRLFDSAARLIGTVPATLLPTSSIHLGNSRSHQPVSVMSSCAAENRLDLSRPATG